MKFCVVGLGRMGRRHLQVAKNLGFDIAGVYDPILESVEMALREFGLPASVVFDSAQRMLETVRPDALVVASTSPSHCEYVCMAAAAGVRYVMCEKPMASSLAEANAMIDACRRAGTTLAVNHQMRFMSQYTQVKALIGSDEFGALASILVAGSNFGLAMNASHYFEAFRYISDSPVQSVQAWFEPGQLANPRGPQFEDRSGRLLARSLAGPSMYIDFSAAAGWGLQVVYTCRHGQIVVDELSGEIRVAARQPEFRDLPTTRYGMPANVRQFAIEPADTIVPTMEVWLALLDGQPFPDGAAGAHALACLVAAHASHEAGGSDVRLDDPALPGARMFNWA
jgi:predicted dehydrogenase